MRRLFVSVALLAIPFMGAGCLKKQAETAPQGAQATANAGSSAAEAAEPVVALTPAQELDAALKRFRDHKSFRAKLNMPEAKLPLEGIIEVSKPGRMRATMRLGDVGGMEIIIAGGNAYIREDGGAWKDISDLPEGRKLSDMLYAFTAGRTSLDNYGVGKDDAVTKSRDEGRKCDRYDATLKGRDGKLNTLQICTDDGLVRFVTIGTKDNGPVTFEYYDHDVLFLIERPI